MRSGVFAISLGLQSGIGAPFGILSSRDLDLRAVENPRTSGVYRVEPTETNGHPSSSDAAQSSGMSPDAHKSSSTKEPHRRFSVWIDGRLLPSTVLAVSVAAAVQAVYDRCGVDRSSEVIARPRIAEANSEPRNGVDDRGPPSTAADGLAFKLGCTLAGWTPTVAGQKARLSPLQRRALETGTSTASVKEAGFGALAAHGVPVGALLTIATEFQARCKNEEPRNRTRRAQQRGHREGA